MLCSFLLYSKVNQLYIYIGTLFFRFYSHIDHYRVLSRVPCALHQVLISYLLYIQQCIYVNPNLPITFFFYKFIYLFLFSAASGLCCCAQAFLQLRRAGATLRCCARASHWVASLVSEHGLQVHGLQSLWHVGSVVVAHGLQSLGSVVVAHRLSCSAACGIFLDQGSNLCPLHWQVDS